MKVPFLVYELEAEQPPWSKRGRWSSCEDDPDLPVRLKANPIGCFLAENAAEACTDAARFEGRAGNFLAQEALFHKVDFTAHTSDKLIEELAERPKKPHFYCCYGHFCCERHPRGDRRDDSGETGPSGSDEGGSDLGEESRGGAYEGVTAAELQVKRPGAVKGSDRN